MASTHAACDPGRHHATLLTAAAAAGSPVRRTTSVPRSERRDGVRAPAGWPSARTRRPDRLAVGVLQAINHCGDRGLDVDRRGGGARPDRCVQQRPRAAWLGRRACRTHRPSSTTSRRSTSGANGMWVLSRSRPGRRPPRYLVLTSALSAPSGCRRARPRRCCVGSRGRTRPGLNPAHVESDRVRQSVEEVDLAGPQLAARAQFETSIAESRPRATATSSRSALPRTSTQRSPRPTSRSRTSTASGRPRGRR